jgi:hypothetical protein
MKRINNTRNRSPRVLAIISLALCAASLISAGNAVAHGSAAATGSLLGAPAKTATPVVVKADPSLRAFSDKEEITNVQAVETLPANLRPTDTDARGDWLYVVTDGHVLVNGKWAASVCPTFGSFTQRPSPGKSLAALRGVLFQRLAEKRKVQVKGAELVNVARAAITNCPGVTTSRDTFFLLGKPVAFATDLTLPR